MAGRARGTHDACEHLEQIWMPLIDRIIGSDAMVTWRGADIGVAVTRLLGFVARRAGWIRTLAGLGGAELGEALADVAREIVSGRAPTT